MKYILSTTGSKVLTFGMLIILVAAATFIGWGQWHIYESNKQVEEMNQRFIAAVNIAYDQQKDLDVGGPTPYDTLYRYTELLQINADKLASTYFTMDTRGAQLTRMDGVSYNQRWDYIWLLKADQEILKSNNYPGSSLSISSPLPLVMQKASSGVWQIVSTDYTF